MSNFNFLTSSKELFQKLLSDYHEFLNDPLNAFKALDWASSAWHLTDWVFNEYEQQNFTNIGTMRDAFIQSCEELKIMHDITTGSKHFTVSRPKSDMSGTHLHEGPFSREFSLEFEVPCLMVDFKNKDSEPIDIILEKVVDFWSLYFESKTGEPQSKL